MCVVVEVWSLTCLYIEQYVVKILTTSPCAALGVILSLLLSLPPPSSLSSPPSSLSFSLALSPFHPDPGRGAGRYGPSSHMSNGYSSRSPGNPRRNVPGNSPGYIYSIVL